MKNLENWQEIVFCLTASEIPPNPPLKKGGRGDFWQGSGCRGNPGYGLRPCQPANSIYK
jgi:hypothetical protein